MAEIELSVFSRQCLNRRIPDGATLTRELQPVRRRNEAHATIAWRMHALCVISILPSKIIWTDY